VALLRKMTCNLRHPMGLRGNRMVAFGVCFPLPCSSAGRRFAVSISRLDHYFGLFLQQWIRCNALYTEFYLRICVRSRNTQPHLNMAPSATHLALCKIGHLQKEGNSKRNGMIPSSFTMQCIAVCRSVLQCVAVCCSVLQLYTFYCAQWLLCIFSHFGRLCNKFQQLVTKYTATYLATHCNTLQHINSHKLSTL